MRAIRRHRRFGMHWLTEPRGEKVRPARPKARMATCALRRFPVGAGRTRAGGRTACGVVTTGQDCRIAGFDRGACNPAHFCNLARTDCGTISCQTPRGQAAVWFPALPRLED